MKVINLLKYNRHWEKGFNYPFEKKRYIFKLLLENISKKPIIEIVGLRRTGKTTLFFQLINHLLKQKTALPFYLWYFTFDEEQPNLDTLIQNFSQQTKVNFQSKEKIYLFLDEIQKLPNFQNQLKVYYDLYPNLKFIISGSASLFIRKKTQESLAGRLISFFLPPLSFKEYLYFKEKDHFLENLLLYQSVLEQEFSSFLESQFIESINLKTSLERKEYFQSIIKKIIFEDMTLLFSVDNPEVLWRICQIVGQNPGILINLQKFSQELDISNKTLSNYFFYLEEAFLLKKVYNFSRNLLTSEKKLKKFYLASPSFCLAVSDFIETGKLLENYFISLKNYRFFWRDAYQHEVDFIEIENKKIKPIEVKYKEKIEPAELKNLILFSKKFNTNQATIWYKGIEQLKKKINHLELIYKPIYHFF